MKRFNIHSCVLILMTLSITWLLKTYNNSNQAETMYSGPIIDMHIHAYGENHPMLGMTHPPTLRQKTYVGAETKEALKEKTFEKFKAHNIVKAVVTNGKIWQEGHEETILMANAHHTVEELRNQYEQKQLSVIAEMSPFYDGILADDSPMLPYFELAQELGIPVGFHLFPGGPNYGIHFMPKMLGKMRAKNANPSQLDEVLVKYPNLKIYIMHGAWPYIEDLKALMYMHPNVYVDIAVLNWILPQKELENYLSALIDAGFGDRILFGTDQMVWPETIDDAVESVNTIDFLSLDQKEDIFYDNAAKFLGLSEEEIRQHKGN